MSTNQPILTIEVPGRAVSANRRIGIDRRYRGRVYITTEARQWKSDVAWWARQFWMTRKGEMCWHDPRLPLRIVCHVRGTRADADNLSKLILDGLKDGLGIDDRNFNPVEMHATAKGLKKPGVTIEVYEAEDDKAA